MTKEQAEKLLQKYEKGLCSEEELALLESWYIHLNEHKPADISNEEVEAAEIRMMQALAIQQTSVFSLWKKVAVAASLILICATSYYLIKPQFDNKPIIAAHKTISAGGEKAILILADGKEIDLEKSASGKLANEDGIAVFKKASGLLEYGVAEKAAVANKGLNTIITPRGGTYLVVLADGTKVWLNSESSIKFPVAFNGKERMVEMSGEAYFEVAKSTNKPFIVQSAGQSVQVLGTKFNINSYKNEDVLTTTLVEGKVRVTNLRDQVLIRPGQQAVARIDQQFKLNDVNPDDHIAWMNGMFSFNKANLITVLRQFERWYNIDVTYPAQVPDIVFTGKIYRNLSLNEALANLTFLGVKFKIYDRKVIVQEDIKD